MIRKLLVAMVAAAMLVATAAPAFAQNGPQLAPSEPNDPINLALANLEQECEIDQEQNTVVVQSNEQNQEALKGFVVVNTGDVHQSQSAQNNATVVPIQNNSGDVECDAAIVQLQDLLDLWLLGFLDRNGQQPNGA